MTLLEFARGPAFQASVLIMIAGIVWRLTGVLLLRRRPQHAAARHSLAARVGGGVTMVVTSAWLLFFSAVPRTFW